MLLLTAAVVVVVVVVDVVEVVEVVDVVTPLAGAGVKILCKGIKVL